MGGGGGTGAWPSASGGRRRPGPQQGKGLFGYNGYDNAEERNWLLSGFWYKSVFPRRMGKPAFKWLLVSGFKAPLDESDFKTPFTQRRFKATSQKPLKSRFAQKTEKNRLSLEAT